MKKTAKTVQHATSLLQSLNTLLPLKWHYCFECILGLFLKPDQRVTLTNIIGVSSSTASRLFQHSAMNLELAWQMLVKWQVELIKASARVKKAGRRPPLYLRVDLTSIEKAGSLLPFIRLFNRVKGIHIVVLHVSYGDLSFAVGYRIFEAKNKLTPIELALDLLKSWSPRCWGGWDVRLIADSGFISQAFVEQTHKLGFVHVSVGGKNNLVLKDGRHLENCSKGECIELQMVVGLKLWVSWVDLPRLVNGVRVMKRFFVLSTRKGTARTLVRVYGKRWLIESFFKSVKYDFGLNETRLRTEQGMKTWIFMSLLAYAIVSVERASYGRRVMQGNADKFVLSLNQAAALLREVLCEGTTS
jgi:Transposase DDE domain